MNQSNLSPALLAILLPLGTNTFTAFSEEQPAADSPKSAYTKAAEATAKSDVDQEKKADEWVASLKLADFAKSSRVATIITTHLKTIRDWHNENPHTTVPAGINPVTGKPLSTLDRQIIANSAMPKTVHENMMAGLRSELSAEQVEAVLDKHTVGKVAFTMKGYKAIVPDLTADEEKTILAFLKQARGSRGLQGHDPDFGHL